MEALYKLSVILNLVDNLTSPVRGACDSVSGMTRTLQNLNMGFANMTKAGMVMTGVGKEITTAVLAPVASVFETKKALGELSSVGIQDLETLEKASKDFSGTWAGTTKAEFISAAYDIKSGISSLSDEAVAEYTKIAGITAKGTKASIGEMTDLFATGYGIYKDYYKDLSDIEFGEIFSAGIAKSVQQFKTDGSKMAQAIQTLGASATTSNVPLEEQLSILGMLQATMSGSEAGTKYKAFLQAAAGAGDKLGLKFTDANNQLLSMPEILAMLKGEFGETMDAAEKMKLKEAFGTDEAVALIDMLYNKTGDLESNILSLYDNMGQGINVATEMADAINSTEGEQFKVLKQDIQNIVEEIGNNMLPTVNKWLVIGKEVLTQISSWIDDNGELAGSIGIAVAVIGMVLMVLGTLGTVIGFVGTGISGLALSFVKLGGVIKGIPGAFETLQIKAMYAGDAIKAGFLRIKAGASAVITGIKNVSIQIISMAKTAAVNGLNGLKSMATGLITMGKQAISTAASAMPPLIASVWSFTAALLANPITWIVIAVIALIAGIILLWKNWDKVSAWVKGVWNAAVEKVIGVFNWLKDILSDTPNWLLGIISAFMPFIGIPLLIIKNWDVIKEFFANLWDSVKSAFTGALNKFSEMPGWVQVVLGALAPFITIPMSIIQNWGTIKEFFINTWNSIKTGFDTFFNSFIPSLITSGKKIMSTLAEGIKSAAGEPVKALKSGFQKMRQLLPFSDAKEGPLSQLTLSGSRIFTTIGDGMKKSMDVPKTVTDSAFGNVINFTDFADKLDYSKLNKADTVQSTLENKENQVVNISSITDKNNLKPDENKNNSVDNTYNVTINVDLSKIKDLQLLQQLLDEVKDQSVKSDNNSKSNISA